MRTWIFADFAVPTQGDIELYQSCGISDVVLGVTTDRTTFKINATEKGWLNSCDAIREAGMKPHVMSWSVPTPKYMEAALKTLSSWAPRGGIGSILFDKEGTWHAGKEPARAEAIRVLADFAKSEPIDVGVTGLDILHKTVAPVIPFCRYILPQAYSFWKPGTADHWSHSAHTFPGPQQRRAYESWWVTHPDKAFVMGLACYWGDRPQQGVAPAVTDEQSMRYAMAETVAIWNEIAEPGSGHRTEDFWGSAYWSGKHLRGTSQLALDRQAFLKMVSEA